MKVHQWTAIATIPLSQADAAEAMARGMVGRDIKDIDVKDIQIGCINCERELRQAFGTPCDAAPYTWEDGDQ